MQPSKSNLTSYSEIIARERKGSTRQADVPIGHAVSLPLPTLRFQVPAYAVFASPCEREAEKPFRQGPPDRWWVLDAHGGAMMLFATYHCFPFSADSFQAVTLPPTAATVPELRKQLVEITQLVDALAPQFFANEPAAGEQRQQLDQLLRLRIPEPLWAQYEAMTPDFFAWLRS